MDTNNPVVKLCMDGMAAEAKGKFDDAHQLFEQAWSICQDDYDACMAAHFLARHQDTPQAVFEWNQEALNRANLVADDRVLSFYASLYLNLGHSYETLGKAESEWSFLASVSYESCSNEALWGEEITNNCPTDPRWRYRIRLIDSPPSTWKRRSSRGTPSLGRNKPGILETYEGE